MICINNTPLEGNSVAPPLTIGQEYNIVKTHTCVCKQEHYDVGLKSEYTYITCYKCKRQLPQGDIIHWCWPGRFENKAQ